MTEKQLFYPLLSVYFSLILGDLQNEKLQIVSIFRFGHKKRGLFQCPPNGRVVNPSPADWKEISDALTLLNQATAPNREAYMERIATNDLAARVKLNDLSNNMDLTRIPNPTENDRRRNDRYCAEYDFLLDKLYGPSHA